MAERIGLDDYIADLPYKFGYELNDHVVLVGTNENMNPLVTGAIPWDKVSSRDDVYTATEQCVEALQSTQSQNILIIGYGPDGDDHAQRVRDAVTDTMPDAMAVIEMHVNDGQYQITRPSELRTEPATVPEPRPETLLAGHQAPASSETDLQARYDPLPEPSYPTLDADTATQLDDTPPSTRADIATRYLTQLADRVSPDSTRQQSILAYAMTTDDNVRDAVMVTAIDDPPKTETLVQLYRGAPDHQRPTLATTAATVIFANGDSSTRTEAALRHGDPDAQLTQLVTVATRSGMPPQPFKQVLKTPTDLAAADNAWKTQRIVNPPSRAHQPKPQQRNQQADRDPPGHRDRGPER